MAILLGTIVGGFAAKDGNASGALRRRDDHDSRCSAGARACFIPPTGAARPTCGSTEHLRSTGGAAEARLRADRRLWWGGLATSWFWLVGAVVLSLLPPLVKNSARRRPKRSSPSICAIFSVAHRDRLACFAAWLAHGRIVLLPDAGRRALSARPVALDLGCDDLRRSRCAGSTGRGAVLRSLARASMWRSTLPASPSRAASSSCRPSPPCRPGPAPTSAPASSRPSTCSTPPSWWSGTLALAALQTCAAERRRVAVHAASASLTLRRASSWIAATCRRTALRDFLVDPVPRLATGSRCRARRTSTTAGPQRRSSRSTTSASSTPPLRSRCCDKDAGLRHRLRHRAALVGEAVPASSRARMPLDPTRSRWRRAR